ncbi:hypothetical protein UFOVP450_197 [uncultured Caudovirales phage]|uniref:Uncharacterized protein n=1 Tax=uncultured Caudovirales phage TaxID=2100421 RepID=A0A6J5MAH9_9CAUD|nr:hypothetical protein UFOVP450_197 [uncultured Caudovirales phage]
MANITQINGNLINAATASYVAGISTLSAVQVFRTSSYLLTNTFTDLIFTTFSLQNNPTIVSHSTSNKARIHIGQSGLYQITYHTTNGIATPGNGAGGAAGGINDYIFQLVKNGSQAISGSFVNGRNSSTDLTVATAQVMVELTANDYITLQTRISGSTTQNSVVYESASLNVVKLDGIVGPQGPAGSGGGVTGGTTNYVPLFNSATSLTSSIMSYDLAKNELVISGNLHVNGNVFIGNEVEGIQGQVLGIARVNNLFSGF